MKREQPITAAEWRELDKKAKAKAKREKQKAIDLALKTRFCQTLKDHNIEFVCEYYFNKQKLYGKEDWHSDYYFPAANLVLENEGGVWINGGHNRGSGFIKNIDKYNALTMAGIKLLRCIPQTLNSPELLNKIKQLCKQN